MKEKDAIFFASIVCIITCLVSVACIFYNVKTAKTNDLKNVVYKNLTTTVEYMNGTAIELNSTIKSKTVTKKVVIKNTGEDDVYIDFIWKNIDTDMVGTNIIYKISGTSLNLIGSPSTQEGVIPTTTTNGLLMGELIQTGNTVEYTLTFTNTEKTSLNYLLANIGVNVRN